jgi:hypothetical protein
MGRVGLKYLMGLLLVYAGHLVISQALLADDQKPSFQVDSKVIDHGVGRGRPEAEYISIRNTGRIEITEISYKGDFRDPKSWETIQIPPQTAAYLSNCKLTPSNTCFIKVNFPDPMWAGTYNGALVLTSPGADDRSIGVVIRSRGPLRVRQGSPAFYALPTFLFAAVIFAGFALSWLLDKWIGTDLPREQALFSLRNSLTEFSTASDRINKWPTNHPNLCGFPITTRRLAIIGPEITRLIAGARQSSPTDLASAAQSYGLDSAKLSLLSSALDLIESQNSQNGNDPATVANLNSSIKRIDPVDFSDGTPVASYRSNIVNGLSISTVATPAAPGAPTSSNVGNDLPDTDSIEAAQKKTHAYILMITNTQHLVVWIVVGLTGFSTIYLPNWSFGTAADYIASFLWSLGLTQTGKQLISRTR